MHDPELANEFFDILWATKWTREEFLDIRALESIFKTRDMNKNIDFGPREEDK
jgi:hypothetical protein